MAKMSKNFFYEYQVTFQWLRGDEYTTFVVADLPSSYEDGPSTDTEKTLVEMALAQCLRDNGFELANFHNVEVVLLDIIEE